MTTSYDLLSGWTEKKFQSTSQSQTCIKKRSRSLIHYSFLNPGKTITSEKYAQQISEMHQKLQHLQPSLVNRKGPILLPATHGTNQCFNSSMNWAMKFCLIHHIHLTSHQLTTTSSSISTTFCKETASTTIKREKMLPNSSSNPKTWISTLQE